MSSPLLLNVCSPVECRGDLLLNVRSLVERRGDLLIARFAAGEELAATRSPGWLLLFVRRFRRGGFAVVLAAVL